MDIERQIRRTIDAVSAAVAGEAEWTTASRALEDLVGARNHTLFVGAPASGAFEVLSTGHDVSDGRRYREYYHKLDLWAIRGAARRNPAPFLGTELVPAEQLRKSEIFTDHLRPTGVFHVAGAIMPLGGSADSLFLGLHRPELSPDFEERHCLALQEVLPHLRRGLRLRQELSAATGAAQAAMAGLAALGTPALAVDLNNRILFANPLSAALLQARRGLASRAGHCVAADPADTEAVAALIRLVARGGSGGLLRLRAAAGGASLTLMASRPADAGPPGVVLLFLLDPTARRAQARAGLLQVMYGLTPAEAEVAEAASRGEAAACIAFQRGTSEATVRAQLRVVLDKTATKNLRELAATVIALPEEPA